MIPTSLIFHINANLFKPHIQRLESRLREALLKVARVGKRYAARPGKALHCEIDEKRYVTRSGEKDCVMTKITAADENIFLISILGGRGVLPKKMDRGVQPASQNPYLIYE